MRTSTRILAGAAGLAVLIAGCGAASHIHALQPPTVKASGKISVPAVTTAKSSGFQRGIDIDWYNYKGLQVEPSAVATRNYLLSLHADAVSISFPFFMRGTRSGSVHATSATPTAAELATAVKVFKQAGFYVSLRPLLDETSLGQARVGWRPANQTAWFAAYERFLKPYAKMASQDKVNEFIVGTELTGFDLSSRWNKLDRLMRSWYGGTLACADNWTQITAKGCGSVTPAVDAYHPAPAASLLAAWKDFDHKLRRGEVETEVGIAAAKGANNRPWVTSWPVHKTDPQLQAKWFTNACEAAYSTHLDGIYFWPVGLATSQSHGPTLASQTTWSGGPGGRAISRCYAAIAKGGK
jgi:hypothetical protein